MEKVKYLRDVMNSKSYNHFRHSINADDIGKISFYYAIESRLYNSVWNKEKSTYVKGPLWFTNIMVFDFDFDEKHFPNINDYHKKLKDSLNKLESILGTPHYIIYNKNSSKFDKFQIETFFTKIENDKKVINLPKKYGCQVVYELKESVKSQFPETVKLYHNLRNEINKLTDGDMNFKGHMFKNFYNKKLFDVKEFDNYDSIDIFKLSKKYCNDYDGETIDNIKNLPAFHRLDYYPKIFREYNQRLYSFYNDLNTYKLKFKNYKNNTDNTFSENFNSDKLIDVNCIKFNTTSRNETLFYLFQRMNIEQLSKLDYSDYKNIISSNIFDSCDIKDCLSYEEFENTRLSVYTYKNNHSNNLDFVPFNYDLESKTINNNKVFNIVEEPFNINFLNKNLKTKLEIIYRRIDNLDKKIKNNKKNYVKIKTTINSKSHKKSSIKIDLYNCNSYSKYLANIFILLHPEFIIRNIKNLFTPNFVNYINSLLCKKFNKSNDFYGLYDLYTIFHNALYLMHFKYYNSLKKFKEDIKLKNKKKVSKTINRSNKINRRLKYFGVYYNGNIKGFAKYYYKLKKHKLLKTVIKPMPISFYRQKFNIRNSYATLFVRKIKEFIKSAKINFTTPLKNIIINNSYIFYGCSIINLILYKSIFKFLCKLKLDNIIYTTSIQYFDYSSNNIYINNHYNLVI